MIIGTIFLVMGLVGLGLAKRLSAKQGATDTLGYVVAIMMMAAGFGTCWRAAGSWLLQGTGLLVLLVCGAAILAGMFYTVWSFAYTNAEFDKP